MEMGEEMQIIPVQTGTLICKLGEFFDIGNVGWMDG